MDFFERAHVPPVVSSKKENKSEGAMKNHLKQMLNAYKRGNNQEIKSLENTQHECDVYDSKSASDYSDIYFHKKPDNTIDTTRSHTSEALPSSEELQSSLDYTSSVSNELDHSSSKSNATESECSVNPETKSDYQEELNSASSPRENFSTEQDLSTFDSSIPSDGYSDSDITIPSSSKSSTINSDASDDEAFDPDGELANRILKRLGKNLQLSKKRKLAKEDIPENSPKKDKKKEDKKLKESSSKNIVKSKTKSNTKIKAPKRKDLTEIQAFNVEARDKPNLAYRNIATEVSEESFHDYGDYEDSLASDNSSEFISFTASDMQSQSLVDIVGDYVHPTIRNLPSEKQNIVYAQPGDYTILDEVINDNSEDLSSLIPEIDEELAIEDLTLETEQQEPEESTAYDNTAETEYYFEQDCSTENIDPTPVPIKVYRSKKGYIIVLKHPTELFVHGKVKVTAIGSSVEISGFTLQDESTDIYAPYTNFAHRIRTIENLNAFEGLFSQLLSAGLSETEGEEIVSVLTDYDAVIALSKLNCPKIDFVDNNFTVTELFTKRVDHTPKALKKVAENLVCSLYLDQPRKFLEEKSSWEQVVECGKKPQSRGIICGGKGTGKSTLLRYYVNRLLADGPVLVIDLDPGQAEFTMPGNISVNIVNHPLIGPNFTHLRSPEKMLNIGMINTMDNPARYISAVKELISFCHSNEAYHAMPWIVNTMGMCNQMGLKFLTYIILELQPTFVYQIDSKLPKKRFEFALQPQAITNFCEEHMNKNQFYNRKDVYSLDYMFILGVVEENSTHQKESGFTLLPKHERYLNVLAYFGELLDLYGKSILEIVPYEVDIRDVSIGFNVKIPEQAQQKVINGKIIALCQLPAADKEKIFTLGDNALLCHGHGLIRGIDFEKGLLYILTPVSMEELKLVNTLVYADWMPELSGQETELPSGTVVPYRTSAVFEERSLMFSPRRRFNPIQLLKATRSA